MLPYLAADREPLSVNSHLVYLPIVGEDLADSLPHVSNLTR